MEEADTTMGEQKKVNLTEGAGQEYLKGQQQGCQLSLLVHIEKKPEKDNRMGQIFRQK